MSWSDPNTMNGVPAHTDPALYDPNVIASMQNGMPCANGQRLLTKQHATMEGIGTCRSRKVGVLDNSMKQAEWRCKETPSEYFNKYFKRGRPELLWLIQKPQNRRSKTKRKRGDKEKGDSDDEGRKYNPGGHGGHGYMDGGDQDMQLIPKADYNSIRNEIWHLQQSPGPQPNNRPLALLPPQTAREAQPPSPRISTQSNSTRPTVSPREQQRPQGFYSKQQQQQQEPRNLSTSPHTPLKNFFTPATPSPAVKSETPPVLQIPENSDSMTSVINSVHANSSSTMTRPRSDSPAALSHYHTADGITPLMHQQREDILSLMYHTASPNMNGDNANSANNTLVNPQPPPMPPLEHLGHDQEQLDVFRSEEQAACVQNISERLAPMSPSGMIPGLAEYTDSYGNQLNAPLSDFDLDSIIAGVGNYFTDPAPAITASATVENNFTTLFNMDFDFSNFDNGTNFPPTNQGQQDLFGDDSASNVAENGKGRIIETSPAVVRTAPHRPSRMVKRKPSRSLREKRGTG